MINSGNNTPGYVRRIIQNRTSPPTDCVCVWLFLAKWTEWQTFLVKQMPNTQYSSFIILFVLGEVSRNIVTEVNFLEWNDAEDNGRMWRMYASKVYETYTSNDVQTTITYSAWLRLQIVCSLMKCAHILRFTMIKIRFFSVDRFYLNRSDASEATKNTNVQPEREWET